MAPSGGAAGAQLDSTRDQTRDPDYVTLSFDHRAALNGAHQHGAQAEASQPVVKPKRGVKKQQAQRSFTKGPPLESERIYQNYPMLSSPVESGREPDEPEYYDERDRQFATAICIFSSVLTMVLVLMFYLVGEAAFRSILLILSFVFFITLFLACFLRRPSSIIFTRNQNSHSAEPRSITYPHSQASNHKSSQLFLIVPNGAATPKHTLPTDYRDVSPICPIHHQTPEILSACSFTHESFTPSPPPPIPPKSPLAPTPPPIQTIPKRKTSVSSHSTLSWDSSLDIRKSKPKERHDS